MFTDAKIIAVGSDDAEYHAAQSVERGHPDFVMSVSALREFANCPSRWRAGFVPPDSAAMQDGSLFDCLLLTPQHFKKRYAVRPENYTNDKGEVKPWNGNSNTCKAWLAEHPKWTTQAAVDEVKTAIARLRSDEIVASWLDCCDTQVWVEAIWNDKPTGLRVRCKSLIDFVPSREKETTVSFATSLGDLKRTRNAATKSWQRWCYQAGYHIAGAFYTDIFNATVPEGVRQREQFCFILSENFPPYEPGKRILSQDFTDLGRASYRTMLGNYCQCRKSGKWPSYDDNDEAIQGWGLVTPEPWQAMNEQFAVKYDYGSAPSEDIPFTADPSEVLT